ncbi:hypothetical protein BJ912DRAFT_1141797 [Pholiota molesta]|nr:hypothetical protein BJ912DRAFT_1141797 [Pholiota molesta]
MAFTHLVQVIQRREIRHHSTKDKLPYDILRHIFLLTLTRSSLPHNKTVFTPPYSSDDRYKYVIAPSLSTEPMSFTYVCSWWRVVALSVPELWTPISAAQNWTLSTTYGVLRVWMNNIRISSAPRAFPLDLHLDSYLPTEANARAREILRMTRTLQLFWQHLGMIRSLRLGLSPQLAEALAELLQYRDAEYEMAMTLEEVHFTFKSPDQLGVKKINSIIEWLGGLPALRRIQWIYYPSGVPAYRGVNMESLPWEKLEDITIRFPMTLEETVTFISRCTSAKTMSLTTVRRTLDDDDSPIAHVPIVTLPLLTSLNIYDLDAGNSLFNYLTLPALKVLRIQVFPQFLAPVNIGLRGFLARSRCALEELIIRHPNQDTNRFYAYPGVAKLKVLDVFQGRSSEITEQFFKDGGKEQLARLGIKRVVLWVYRGSVPGLQWKPMLDGRINLGRTNMLMVRANGPSNARNTFRGGASGSQQQQNNPLSPPPQRRSLIANLEGTSDPQDGSPLFITIPPEIRNRIFAFALTSYDDKSRPYPEDAYYYRPGYHYCQRIDTALLATCRRIYSETHDLPVSHNEHVFWGSADRGPPGLKFSEKPRRYFKQMTLDQRKAVVDVHLFTQLFWLEGKFPNVCDEMNPKRMRITVRHTDWWFWESNTRLIMKTGWGDDLKSIKELEVLEVELETMERDKAQLDAIVKSMNTWMFALDGDRKLTTEGNQLVHERYMGQGSFNQSGHITLYNPTSNRWNAIQRPSVSAPAPTIQQIPYVVSILRWTAKQNQT